jgi:hypothetical protein
MNRTLLQGSLAVAFAAAIAIPGQSAKADETITTITSPVIVSSRTTTTTTNGSLETLAPGPGMLVTNSLGQQLMVPSNMSSNQILFVTTGGTITGFTCCTPDDLITRRDDLLARIFAEKATGKLSADQANDLIAEVQTAFAERDGLTKGDESDVDHVKGVKRIYKAFDRASNDIQKQSHQGNRQLAGKYNYVVL